MTRAAAALWTWFVGWTAVATVTLAAVNPPKPRADVAWPGAVAVGVAAGIALFAIVLRRPPRRFGGRRGHGLLTTHAFLALCVVNEELVWRRFVLGELLAGGPLVAVAASSVAFAGVHRRRRLTHVLTGGVFGSVYVLTGAISAAVAAHWTYNALVALASTPAPVRTAEVRG